MKHKNHNKHRARLLTAAFAAVMILSMYGTSRRGFLPAPKEARPAKATSSPVIMPRFGKSSRSQDTTQTTDFPESSCLRAPRRALRRSLKK